MTAFCLPFPPPGAAPPRFVVRDGNMKKVLMARKEYVSLYEKVAAAGDSVNNSSKKSLSPLAVPEQRRLDELEEELPLQAIVMFRTMARKEVRLFTAAAAAVAALPRYAHPHPLPLAYCGAFRAIVQTAFWACRNTNGRTTEPYNTNHNSFHFQVQRKRKEERAKTGRDKEDDKAAVDKKKKGRWWGGLWSGGGDKGVKEEGDVAIEDLTASFEDQEESKVREGGK